MSRTEVHHLAQSISRWVWRNITPEKTAARREAWGRALGRRSGVVRRNGLTVEMLEEADAR